MKTFSKIFAPHTAAALHATGYGNTDTCQLVSSFFERWSHAPHSPTSPPTDQGRFAPSPTYKTKGVLVKEGPASLNESPIHNYAASRLDEPPLNTESPTPPRTRANTAGSRNSSRPSSMAQTYQPPLMEVANDTPPELQPIFTFLNSHSNKLYQEGYFLKLHDLDTRGRPSKDRAWQECFAVCFA
jgi:CCR4-NOT transcriptional complex subunit CAF120